MHTHVVNMIRCAVNGRLHAFEAHLRVLVSHGISPCAYLNHPLAFVNVHVLETILQTLVSTNTMDDCVEMLMDHICSQRTCLQEKLLNRFVHTNGITQLHISGALAYSLSHRNIRAARTLLSALEDIAHGKKCMLPYLEHIRTNVVEL
jgi:hypothetical protein